MNFATAKNFAITEPFARREVRFLELWQPTGWSIKIYGLTHPRRAMPGGEFLAAVKMLAAPLLGSVAPQDHHGAGFFILHAARKANFILLDHWTGENTIRQNAYTSTFDEPEAFTDMTASRLVACVWELQVLSFERQAWLDAVLANPAGPDLDAYLDQRMNGYV